MNGGIKHDQDKLRYDLIPFDVLEEYVKVLTFGANKYSSRNWEAGFNWSRCFAAALRHLTSWFRGQDKDPETGLSHLAHAMCCVTFLLAFELRKAGTDDRPATESPIIEKKETGCLIEMPIQDFQIKI